MQSEILRGGFMPLRRGEPGQGPLPFSGPPRGVLRPGVNPDANIFTVAKNKQDNARRLILINAAKKGAGAAIDGSFSPRLWTDSIPANSRLMAGHCARRRLLSSCSCRPSDYWSL